MANQINGYLITRNCFTDHAKNNGIVIKLISKVKYAQKRIILSLQSKLNLILNKKPAFYKHPDIKNP
jgi:hypothetical protein